VDVSFTSLAIVAAGLLSVLIFPLGGLAILRRAESALHRNEATAVETVAV
jgi:hypothetical protein